MRYVHTSNLTTLDQDILDRRTKSKLEHTTPQVGDRVIMPDGTSPRIAHIWEDTGTFQPDDPPGNGSYYLGEGFVGHSGGLDPRLPITHLEETGALEPELYWFFHHGHATAGGGIETHVPTRIWRYKGEM